METFYSTKDPVRRLKRQTTKWEKISTNYMSNLGLVFGIYKECSKSSGRKHNQSNWIKEKRHERHFTEEYMQMANKHIKRYLTLSAIREMHN